MSTKTLGWLVGARDGKKLGSRPYPNEQHFSKHRPSGPVLSQSRDVSLSATLSVCLFVPFYVIFFEASHWPTDHMINSRPLIGQPSFTTKLSTRYGGDGGDGERRGGKRWEGKNKQKNEMKCFKAFWQRCYYPHRSRDALSPVCGVFS